jgi:hypothetical protein
VAYNEVMTVFHGDMVIYALTLYRAYHLKHMCTNQVCSQGGASGCNASTRNLQNIKNKHNWDWPGV